MTESQMKTQPGLLAALGILDAALREGEIAPAVAEALREQVHVMHGQCRALCDVLDRERAKNVAARTIDRSTLLVLAKRFGITEAEMAAAPRTAEDDYRDRCADLAARDGR